MTLHQANLSEYFGNAGRIGSIVGHLNSNFDKERGLAIVVLEDEEDNDQPKDRTPNSQGVDASIDNTEVLLQLLQTSSASNNVTTHSNVSKPDAGVVSKYATTSNKGTSSTKPTIKKENLDSTQESRPVTSTSLKPPVELKEDLKKKIMERRRAAGKHMIDLEKEEENRRKQQESGNQLTQVDIERRLKKRESNNQAAKRCRENRKQLEVVMEKELAAQSRRKKELLQAKTYLEQQKTLVENLWKASSRGDVNQRSLETIRTLMMTIDYSTCVPPPLPVVSLSLDSDANSNGATDLGGGATEDGGAAVDCFVGVAEKVALKKEASFDGFEVDHSGVYSELSRKRKPLEPEVTISKVKVETCSSSGVYKSSGSVSDFGACALRPGSKPVSARLTDDTDTDSGIDNDLFGSQSSIDSNPSVYPIGSRSRQTLFELADATFTEMKEAEELVKPTEAFNETRAENTHKREDTRKDPGDDFDSDIDEDDFVPLVIDFAG